MINWHRIEELKSEVGEEDFAEVLPIFFEEVAETIERLHGLDQEATARAFHFLKGSSANIGMDGLSEHCADLEVRASKQGLAPSDIERTKELFDASRVSLTSSSPL